MEFLLNNLFLLKVIIMVVSCIPYVTRLSKLANKMGYKRAHSIKYYTYAYVFIFLMLLIPYLGWGIAIIAMLTINTKPTEETIKNSKAFIKED